jgi:hypothetical protein
MKLRHPLAIRPSSGLPIRLWMSTLRLRSECRRPVAPYRSNSCYIYAFWHETLPRLCRNDYRSACSSASMPTAADRPGLPVPRDPRGSRSRPRRPGLDGLIRGDDDARHPAFTPDACSARPRNVRIMVAARPVCASCRSAYTRAWPKAGTASPCHFRLRRSRPSSASPSRFLSTSIVAACCTIRVTSNRSSCS